MEGEREREGEGETDRQTDRARELYVENAENLNG